MAENHLVSFSLVFLAVAVAFFAGHGQAQGTDLCAKADYAALCRASVKGSTDPKSAIKVSIEQLLFETERIKEASAKLGTSQPLDACKENFDSAITDLKDSLKYLNSNDVASLKSSLSGAMTFYATCDDAVAEGGIVQLASNVITTDALLRHMATNALYLATLMI